MTKLLRSLWRDERGAEIVEWALVGGLIVAVAAGGYLGSIGSSASGLLDRLGTAIATVVETADRPRATHGAAVASVAKSDAGGADVANKAKTKTTHPEQPGR